jgi:hypothetical protein
MTVDGTMIRCDVKGCHTRSVFESISVVSPDYVRVRSAMRGWTSISDENGEIDHCPVHSTRH